MYEGMNDLATKLQDDSSGVFLHEAIESLRQLAWKAQSANASPIPIAQHDENASIIACAGLCEKVLRTYFEHLHGR
jgi:hypothetical protein